LKSELLDWRRRVQCGRRHIAEKKKQPYYVNDYIYAGRHMKNQTITIRDVAAAAKVSTATVSRVLNNDEMEQVAPKTRERVFQAIEKLGYRINHAARSLKTKSSQAVAIVAPELTNDFFTAIAGVVEQELSKKGYTLLIASSANSIEEEKKRLVMFMDRLVDGIIVIPAGSQGKHLRLLLEQGLPIVLVDRLVEDADLDAVLSDNEGGAFELTRALIADGFRRIAFVGGSPGISTARERLAGYTRALEEAGIRARPEWIYTGGMKIPDGYRHMEAILKTSRPPEALVAVNLMVHVGMQRRLLEYDRNGKPRAMIIAAFDESDYTPFFPYCRYTTAQDIEAIGSQATRRILEQIESKKKAGKAAGSGEEEKRILRIPVRLIRH
jgi:LacI family transcriptional regulator